MLINLSELFTSEGKEKNYTLDIEMTHIQTQDGSCQIVDQKPYLCIFSMQETVPDSLTGEAEFSLMHPCGRCLEPVKVPFHLDIERTLDMNQSEEERIENLDEQPDQKRLSSGCRPAARVTSWCSTCL